MGDFIQPDFSELLMKRTALFTVFLFLAVQGAFAGLYFDTKASYVHSWSTHDSSSDKINQDNMYGCMAGVGYYIHEQFNIRVEGGYHYVEPVRETVDGSYTADSLGLYVSMEFIPFIPLLADIRLFLINSFSVGYIHVSLNTEDMPNPPPGESDTGIQVLVSTGVLYQFSQHVAPFITIGWSGIYYQGEWKDTVSNMVNVTFGVRFFLFNPRTLE